MKNRRWAFLLVLTFALFFSGCEALDSFVSENGGSETYTLAEIPEYAGEPYVVLNDNIPAFTEADMTEDSFEIYSPLDGLGRCGTAFANIGQDLMPTEERGSIGMVKPSGWQTVKYDVVDGKYLYNRCHLIGYQLSGENATEENLITGTRYLNMEGMLPFENMVADYVKETDNHVLYRATPVFEGDDLLTKGVSMEAISVEDGGEGIQFHVFCYNVQPGVYIDYSSGESRLTQDAVGSANEVKTYICNISSGKFHLPSCDSVEDIGEKNKMEFTGSRKELIFQGYEPCKKCNP